MPRSAPCSRHPSCRPSAAGLSHSQALRTVARGLLGGLFGLVIDALLPDKTAGDVQRLP